MTSMIEEAIDIPCMPTCMLSHEDIFSSLNACTTDRARPVSWPCRVFTIANASSCAIAPAPLVRVSPWGTSPSYTHGGLDYSVGHLAEMRYQNIGALIPRRLET